MTGDITKMAMRVGEGVPKEAVNAYAWLNIAAAQGSTNAKKAKELVADDMTQPQTVKAQKRSREYWTRYLVPSQQAPVGTACYRMNRIFWVVRSMTQKIT